MGMGYCEPRWTDGPSHWRWQLRWSLAIFEESVRLTVLYVMLSVLLGIGVLQKPWGLLFCSYLAPLWGFWLFVLTIQREYKCLPVNARTLRIYELAMFTFYVFLIPIMLLLSSVWSTHSVRSMADVVLGAYTPMGALLFLALPLPSPSFFSRPPLRILAKMARALGASIGAAMPVLLAARRYTETNLLTGSPPLPSNPLEKDFAVVAPWITLFHVPLEFFAVSLLLFVCLVVYLSPDDKGGDEPQHEKRRSGGGFSWGGLEASRLAGLLCRGNLWSGILARDSLLTWALLAGIAGPVVSVTHERFTGQEFLYFPVASVILFCFTGKVTLSQWGKLRFYRILPMSRMRLTWSLVAIPLPMLCVSSVATTLTFLLLGHPDKMFLELPYFCLIAGASLTPLVGLTAFGPLGLVCIPAVLWLSALFIFDPAPGATCGLGLAFYVGNALWLYHSLGSSNALYAPPLTGLRGFLARALQSFIEGHYEGGLSE